MKPFSKSLVVKKFCFTTAMNGTVDIIQVVKLSILFVQLSASSQLIIAKGSKTEHIRA